MSLEHLLRRPEGKTLELKRDLSSPTGVLRTLVAFANTSGGTVLLGVEDGTRHVRGIEDPLALEERLASLITDSVEPRLLPELGLIEQWGSGIQRMTSACREAGLAPPELEEIGLRFRVTLRTEQVGEPLIDPLDRAILELLADSSGRSTAEIARHIERSSRATRTRLARLVENGQVVEVGTGPRDPRRRYLLAEGP